MHPGTSFANPGVVQLARTSLLALALLLCGTRASQGEVQPRATVAAGPRGDTSVQIGGRALWRAPTPGTRVVSDVVWSRAGDAVAFATRNQSGRTHLVVVIVRGDLHGQTVTWPVPPRAINATRPTVIWLDARRVVLGASELHPALIASWTTAPD
jgi:hypothetical protein